jgi:hypothetical protein
MMKYPKKIGFVVDIQTMTDYGGKFKVSPASISPVMHLADLLILYDTVSIRLDFFTLQKLYSCFYVKELESLLKEKRIVFVPSIDVDSNASPSLSSGDGTIDTYFNNLHLQLSAFFSQGYLQFDNTDSIITQVSNYTEIPKIQSGNEFHSFVENMEKKFNDSIKAYNSESFMDSFVGFRWGIGRIIDFLASKTTSFHIDSEMIYYLNLIGNPKLNSKIEISKTELSPGTLTSLHTLNHIPSVQSLLAEGKWSRKKLLEVAMSQEAYDLRTWIKNNFSKDFDVRDAYINTMKILPSKKKWISWSRFGVVTSISTAISALLTQNPTLTTVIGVAVGVLDTQYGEKLTDKIFELENPEQWVNYINRNSLSE